MFGWHKNPERAKASAFMKPQLLYTVPHQTFG